MHKNLFLVVVSVTGLRPVEALQVLKDDQNMAGVAESAHKSEDDTPSDFDETDRAVENGCMPGSLVQSRIDWYWGGSLNDRPTQSVAS